MLKKWILKKWILKKWISKSEFCNVKFNFKKWISNSTFQTRPNSLIDTIASNNGYKQKMPYANLLTYSLSYPKSRDAIASKNEFQNLVKWISNRENHKVSSKKGILVIWSLFIHLKTLNTIGRHVPNVLVFTFSLLKHIVFFCGAKVWYLSLFRIVVFPLLSSPSIKRVGALCFHAWTPKKQKKQTNNGFEKG